MAKLKYDNYNLYENFFNKELYSNEKERISIEDTLKFVGIFLVYWNLFEDKFFDKGCNKSKIEKLLTNPRKLREISVNEGVKSTFKYFKERYCDSDLFKKLNNNLEVGAEIKNINEKEEEELSDIEILVYLIYIVFRFRCNMFHGNKKPYNFYKYKEPIEKCVNLLHFLLTKEDVFNIQKEE